MKWRSIRKTGDHFISNKDNHTQEVVETHILETENSLIQGIGGILILKIGSSLTQETKNRISIGKIGDNVLILEIGKTLIPEKKIEGILIKITKK